VFYFSNKNMLDLDTINTFSGLDSGKKKRGSGRVGGSRTWRLWFHWRNNQVKYFGVLTIFLITCFFWFKVSHWKCRDVSSSFFIVFGKYFYNCYNNFFGRARIMSEYLNRVSQDVMSDVRLRRYGKEVSRLLLEQVREFQPKIIK